MQDHQWRLRGPFEVKYLKCLFIVTTVRIEKYVKYIKSITFMELRQGTRYILEYDLRMATKWDLLGQFGSPYQSCDCFIRNDSDILPCSPKNLCQFLVVKITIKKKKKFLRYFRFEQSLCLLYPIIMLRFVAINSFERHEDNMCSAWNSRLTIVQPWYIQPLYTQPW